MSVPASKLRILVLRDPGFRAGAEGQSSEVAAALAGEPGIRVAEGAAGYGEAVRTVQRSDADLVIVEDVAGDPSAVVEQIETAAPDLAIVVVLDEEQKSMAQPCILAGARAYVYRPSWSTWCVGFTPRKIAAAGSAARAAWDRPGGSSRSTAPRAAWARPRWRSTWRSRRTC